MAIVRTTSSPATITALRLRVRRLLGDINGDSAPASGNQRWTDTAIDEQINNQLFEMYSLMSDEDPNYGLRTATLTYTADAASVTLADAYLSAPIYTVHEISGEERHYLRRVDWITLEQHRALDEQDIDLPYGSVGNRVWCLLDGAIAVRPIPSSDLSLQIGYVSNPLTVGSDQHPYPVQFEELIVLGATIRLQEIDENYNESRMARYAVLWERFTNQSERYVGPRRVASRRKFS